jgi:hypothetical protein
MVPRREGRVVRKGTFVERGRKREACEQARYVGSLLSPKLLLARQGRRQKVWLATLARKKAGEASTSRRAPCGCDIAGSEKNPWGTP